MNIKRLIPLLFLVLAFMSSTTQAGNPDRAGEAGATELLINPWAKSSGINGINVSNVRGLESMNVNVAGLAFAHKTEIGFTNTMWLKGSDISINTFGFVQKLGEGAIGISIFTMNVGEIEVTTAELPEGTGSMFKPRVANIGISYARKFADYLSGGVTIRGVFQGISDVTAFGIALDIGIQYVTGTERYPESIKFGIALKNIGTPMKFSGDGLTFRGDAPQGNYSITQLQRAENFELPSLLTIGLSYDIHMGQKNRLTPMANFTSNSFYKDQFGFGLEYALKVKNIEMFQIRGGYLYEADINDSEARTSAHTGISAGFTLELPLKENGPSLGLDYAYRTSSPFSGSHSMGLRFNL